MNGRVLAETSAVFIPHHCAIYGTTRALKLAKLESIN